MKTAIQQCAQDLFETDLSHEDKTKIVNILHTHLTTEKQQIIEAVEETMLEMNLYESFRALKNGEQYYRETFEAFSNDYNEAE